MIAAAAEKADSGAKARIFISYSRKDMAFADRLEAALKARGFEPLIDRAEIYALEDWWKRLQALIESADTVVFVLSPDAVASREALREVEYAASLNKRLAPIVCRRVEDSATPETLRRLNFVFFDDAAQFEASADRLAEALRTDIGWIRRHTEYGEAARQWSAAGRPGGLLLRSPALEEAERWIASRPGEAPTPTEETQAFIAASRSGATRRRNLLTGSLAAGLLVALILAGIAYWQREVAVTQRQRAEQTLAAATKTANDLTYDLAGRFRNQRGVPSALVQEILGRAQNLQEQLTAYGQTSADLQHSQAETLSETALTFLSIGDRSGAFTAADHARQILEALLAKQPGDAGLQLDLGVVYQRIGDALAAAGKRDEALAAYQKAGTIHQALLRAAPDNDKAQRNLAVDYGKVGRLLEDEGKLDDALVRYRKDLALMQALVQREGRKDAVWLHDLGVTYEWIGGVLTQQGKLDEALAALQERLKIAQQLADKSPGNTEYQRDLSVAENKIGDVLMAQNKPEQALDAYRKALAIRQTLAAGDPANALWQRDVAISNNLIGTALTGEAKLDDALAALQQGLSIEQKIAAQDPKNVQWQQDLFISNVTIGNLLVRQNKLDAALQSFRDGLGAAELQAKAHPDDGYWQEALKLGAGKIGAIAFSFILAHKFDVALASAEQALSLAPEMIWIYGNRAHALMFLDRTDEARALYLQYRGQQNVEGQKSWETMVLDDFAELRKASLENPLMDEIEKKFSSGG